MRESNATAYGVVRIALLRRARQGCFVTKDVRSIDITSNRSARRCAISGAVLASTVIAGRARFQARSARFEDAHQRSVRVRDSALSAYAASLRCGVGEVSQRECIPVASTLETTSCMVKRAESAFGREGSWVVLRYRHRFRWLFTLRNRRSEPPARAMGTVAVRSVERRRPAKEPMRLSDAWWRGSVASSSVRGAARRNLQPRARTDRSHQA